MKTGIALEIPGFGRRDIRTIVTDYTGTLSTAGRLAPGVEERLRALDRYLDIHVVTSDTFGTAADELRGVPCVLRLLEGGTDHGAQKREYVLGSCEPGRVAAFGNGNNDALLLEAVKEARGLAIAVDNGEGCALPALLNADLFIAGIASALDLLIDPRRAVATLRR